MADELTFARKASGLVRGLSTYDAFSMGAMLILPLYGIWISLQVGAGIFQGANLVISTLLMAVVFGVPAVFVWGIMSASMPRSGGEYIYNSRILHPAVAMAASFGMVTGQLYWNIYEGSWVADPSLKILGQYLGWSGLVNWVSTKSGTVICAVAVWVLVFLIVAFGMRVYKYFQRPVVAITLALTAVFGCIVLFTSKAHFTMNWNAAAARYHSLTYSQLPLAVAHAQGSAVPHTWSWGDTFGSLSVVYMFVIYAYAMAYVSGEVKRPDKAILRANGFVVIVACGLGVLAFAGLYHMADFKFLSATAYNDLNGGVKGYTFPYSSSFMDLTFIASGFNRVVGVLLSLTWLLSTISILCVIMVMMQRVLFAWGMDRMGPKWFTDISPRWASPIKTYALIAGLSAVLEVVYVLWLEGAFAGLVAAGMMVVSVFAVTAVSAIVFPYRKRAKGIWDSSPYNRLKIFGVPVITIAGVIYLAVVCVVIYFGFLDPKTRDAHAKNLIEFAIVWGLGIIWYFVWKAIGHRKIGDAMSRVYQELPPE